MLHLNARNTYVESACGKQSLVWVLGMREITRRDLTYHIGAVDCTECLKMRRRTAACELSECADRLGELETKQEAK